MVGVAVIGAGYWGPNYVRVFSELDDSSVPWICDLDMGKARRLTKRFPTSRATADLREVLADAATDAVCISTPAGTHYDLARRALAAGKDVLVEKPVTTRSAQGEELAALAEREGRVLMVGHTFEFHPAFLRLLAMVRAGELGRVYYMHATRTGLGPIRRDVNALWDLAPHDLSMFNALAGGEPHTVTASGHPWLQKGVEDVAFATYRYGEGVLASVHVSWLDPVKVRRLTVVGDRKMAVFDDTENLERLKVYDRGVSYQGPEEGVDYGQFRLLLRDGDILVPKVDAAEPLKAEAAHFLDCVRTRAAPRCDAASGVRVVRALEAAERSLRAGGAPVPLREPPMQVRP